MAALPEGVDRALWFRHRGCTGRHYLLGNAHTVPGRMVAWCPRESTSFFLSKGEVESASRAAGFWIDGFLHGVEPDPPQEPDGSTDMRRFRRWQKHAARFRETGTWPGRR